jgi:hypothetical protein
VKYVSNPPSPPQLAKDTQGEGKSKKDREVGEGDDTVTIEDTSKNEDEVTLQEQFQLHSSFNRAGMPNIPVIIKKPTSLEASLPVSPRKPRNVVVHEPVIEEATPICLAPMSDMTSSSRGSLELLDDNLIDPAVVAQSMES